MVKPLRILITDDELQSRTLICKMLQDAGQAGLIMEADSVDDAFEKIHDFRPQLVYLDIQMKGETGFDLLNKFTHINFQIIFTTAHSEHAVKAFRYNAMDYLMKPLDPAEFSASLERAIERIEKQQAFTDQQLLFLKQFLSDGTPIPEKLSIATTEGLHFINLNDILYCHAVNNYTAFHLLNNQKIISSHTLGYYDEWLNKQLFFRVHRSYIINLRHIKLYKRGDGGSLIMTDGHEIEVSRNNKEALLKLFKG